METFTLKVDNQGRISLPSRLREQAGIAPGSEILAFFEDGGIVLATREAALGQAQRLVRAYLPEGVSLVADVLAERHREVNAEQSAEEKHGGRRKSA